MHHLSLNLSDHLKWKGQFHWNIWGDFIDLHCKARVILILSVVWKTENCHQCENVVELDCAMSYSRRLMDERSGGISRDTVSKQQMNDKDEWYAHRWSNDRFVVALKKFFWRMKWTIPLAMKLTFALFTWSEQSSFICQKPDAFEKTSIGQVKYFIEWNKGKDTSMSTITRLVNDRRYAFALVFAWKLFLSCLLIDGVTVNRWDLLKRRRSLSVVFHCRNVLLVYMFLFLAQRERKNELS